VGSSDQSSLRSSVSTVTRALSVVGTERSSHVDVHTKDARAAGEPEQRIYALNAWREIPLCDRYGWRRATALAVKHGQIESADPLRVAEDVDLDDLPAPDREGHDHERLSLERAQRPSDAVDEHRVPEQAEA
jgi:hypothetical protein